MESENINYYIIALDDNFQNQAIIPLNGKKGYGKYAIIDADDFDLVSQHKWHINEERGSVESCNSKNKQNIKIHRLIMEHHFGDSNLIIDHIDRDPLNNRKSNLRFCTYQENTFNKSKQKNCKSGVRGVYWDKSRSKWAAQIQINLKIIPLGRFEKFEDAVKARKEAEKKYYGDFAPCE